MKKWVSTHLLSRPRRISGILDLDNFSAQSGSSQESDNERTRDNKFFDGSQMYLSRGEFWSRLRELNLILGIKIPEQLYQVIKKVRTFFF